MIDNDGEIKKKLDLIRENCIFCKIINKEIESKIVFEDDICIAILDINPASKGHLLLLPKEHYMIYTILPDEILGHLSVISKYLSDLLIETFLAEDVIVYCANGAAAGQQSQHFMYHIIPQYAESSFEIDTNSEEDLSEAELNDFVQKIQKKLIQINAGHKNTTN